MKPADHTAKSARWCFLLISIAAGGTALLSSCTVADFKHEVVGTPQPWTEQPFDSASDKFTFAVFSDLNGGEREGIFEIAVTQLALLRPELIISVGDLIDGGTKNRTRLKQEWDSFDSRAGEARAPIFRVGGNHDLTNDVMRTVWAERFGPRYYHFVYKNVLFLMLDSEDYEPERMQEIYEARAAAIKVMDGEHPDRAQEMDYFKMPEQRTGEIGAAQAAYFQQVLQENAKVRWIFLFMHKPVWLSADDPDYSALELAMTDRPHTVINGHFHTYSHTVKNGRDHIILGTTGGSQLPDSNMSFDHVTLVTVDESEPSIVNLKMDGILDKTGLVPGRTDDICFQASICD